MKYIPFLLLIFIGFACQKEQTTLGTNVFDTFFVQNKGISMPVHVSGNTASKVILVFIPGGPGQAGLSYKDVGMNKIEEKYAVAYTNQRQCGSTQGNSTVPNTIEVMNEDLLLTIKLLKQRYGQDVSIFLMGHSFGSKTAAAFVVAGDNQKNVKGWIDMCGWTDKAAKVATTVRDAYLKYGQQEIALGKNVAIWTPIVDWCKAHPNDLTESELPSFTDPEPLMNAYITNPLTSFLSILFKENLPVTANLASLASLNLSGTLLNELKARDFHSEMKNITIPSLFLVGKYDFICPFASIEDAFKKTGAKEKKIVLFEKSGHQIYANEPDVFAKEVTDFMTKYK
jgi:pimeloyl-ACP methyl ester carboxylesterase